MKLELKYFFFSFVIFCLPTFAHSQDLGLCPIPEQKVEILNFFPEIRSEVLRQMGTFRKTANNTLGDTYKVFMLKNHVRITHETIQKVLGTKRFPWLNRLLFSEVYVGLRKLSQSIDERNYQKASSMVNHCEALFQESSL